MCSIVLLMLRPLPFPFRDCRTQMAACIDVEMHPNMIDVERLGHRQGCEVVGGLRCLNSQTRSAAQFSTDIVVSSRL